MTPEKRHDIITKFLAECVGLLNRKGEDYSRGEADVLSNFRRVSEDLGLTPKEVAWVYARKHIDSIAGYLKTGKSSEPIRGRLQDLVNYLLIIWCLIEEEWPHPIKLNNLHDDGS